MPRLVLLTDSRVTRSLRLASNRELSAGIPVADQPLAWAAHVRSFLPAFRPQTRRPKNSYSKSLRNYLELKSGVRFFIWS